MLLGARDSCVLGSYLTAWTCRQIMYRWTWKRRGVHTLYGSVLKCIAALRDSSHPRRRDLAAVCWQGWSIRKCGAVLLSEAPL